MIKKYKYYFVITPLLLFLSIYFIGCDNKKNNFENQWALSNTGQEVNGQVGTPGIDINFNNVWKITNGSPDITVAIVDSGIDSLSSDLKGKITADSWDFYNNDDSIYDSYKSDYHGTYIANTIAGVDKKNNIYGVAPNISLLSGKFMQGTSGSSAKAILALKHVCEKGADVVNCSWNFNKYNPEMFEVIKDNPDTLFICAAGNSNVNLDEKNIYPACFELDNILTVMAVDNNAQICSSSGYGKKVDIAAPGKDIISTLPENDSTYVSGTSVATAYVSGIASLMLSIDKTLTPGEVKEIIVNTAKKTESLENKNNASGIINAYACVKYISNKERDYE